MSSRLGAWLYGLIRSLAPQTKAVPVEPAPGGLAPQVDQNAHARQAIQIGRVDSMTVLHGPHGLQLQPGGAEGADLQQLQVTVLHLVEASGDRRGAIEAFMQREFGSQRITHLSRAQLWRVQRYCEKIEARRMGRRDRD